MSKKLLRIAPLVIVLASTVSAFAEESDIDARLVGYKDNKAALPQPSASAAWFILAGLGLVAIGPLFLNAHRTHLD